MRCNWRTILSWEVSVQRIRANRVMLYMGGRIFIRPGDTGYIIEDERDLTMYQVVWDGKPTYAELHPSAPFAWKGWLVGKTYVELINE